MEIDNKCQRVLVQAILLKKGAQNIFEKLY
jgi:hypothetical protein